MTKRIENTIQLSSIPLRVFLREEEGENEFTWKEFTQISIEDIKEEEAKYIFISDGNRLYLCIGRDILRKEYYHKDIKERFEKEFSHLELQVFGGGMVKRESFEEGDDVLIFIGKSTDFGKPHQDAFANVEAEVKKINGLVML